MIRGHEAGLVQLEQRGLHVELRPEASLEDLDGRARERGRHRGRHPCGRGETGNPVNEQVIQRARDGERVAGRGQGRAPGESARDLECKERIAFRCLCNPDEQWSRELEANPRLDDLVQGGERERPKDHVFDALRRERTDEINRSSRFRDRAMRDRDPHPRRQPPGDELKSAPRRVIQPLRVVDHDHERITTTQDRDHGQERAGRRSRVCGRVRRPSQQGHFEGLPLGCGQRIPHNVERSPDEVRERRM